MKTHLAKLSLALLSTVFLFGCQEQGSGPVGPEGLGPEFDKPTCEGGTHCNHGDDGGSGSGQGTVDLDVGMVATGLALDMKESGKKLTANSQVSHGGLILNITTNFRKADGSPYGITDCVGDKLGDELTDDEWAGLLGELTTPWEASDIFIEIDKKGGGGLTVGGEATLASHLLLVQRDGTFDSDATTAIKVGRNEHSNELFVKWISSEGSVDVFEFTGPGVAVNAGDPTGGRAARIIVCTFDGPGELGNKVVMTVHR